MAAIDQLINIIITQSTTAVTTGSTTIPLIVGTSKPGWDDGDYVHTYFDSGSLLTDGFKVTDPEYIAAQALVSQKIVPSSFLVGCRLPADAGNTTVKLTINYAAGTASYGLSLDNISFFVSGADQPTVASNLAGALNKGGISGLAASVDSDNNVVVEVSGQTAPTTAQATGLSVGSPSSEAGAAQSLAASLSAISAQNNTWYGLITPAATDDDILSAAGWVESQRKIYIATSATADVGSATSTTDIGAKLQAGSYSRSALLFSPGAAAAGIDAGWLGGFLANTPGSYNTAYMTIAGIQADNLSASQQTACIGNPVAGIKGKNVNIYQAVQGIGITQMGTMGSGEYIDLTVGVDALFFGIQAAVFSDLVNNTKIPYTDRGVAILVAAVRGVLEQYIATGLIDGTEPYSVAAPKVSTVPKALRTGRVAPTITFSCTVQGAVNAIRVTGNVLA